MSRNPYDELPEVASFELTSDDIALRSPGDGLAPHHLNRIIGQRLTAGLESDGDLTLDMVEELTPLPSPASPAWVERKPERVEARI